MGKIYSLLLRPIRTFNIENNAQRIISKDKPVRAPLYSSVEQQKKLVDKLKPDFMEIHYKKDSELDDRLKNVFVKSKDLQDIPKQNISKLQDRSQRSSEDYDFKTYEGKCNIKQVMHFMNMHYENPIEYSVEKISQQYKLDKQIIENILTYFKILHCVADAEQLKLNDGKKK
ncbi:protein NDUFAF4 homolog [Apis dorsata]|uniref:protein NDUFAF4 homolog n=1 Tax=Apis dorsata TaxID=7462 RepID=UPI0003DF5564|nr:protein NDUFAF4 homolog [Apis dorsata]